MNRTRPESEFDAERVFEACRRHGKAVEINCEQERRDPPRRLIRQALEAGCVFSIDSDAHWPGALLTKVEGSERAASEGVTADRIVNSRPADGLVEWTRSHDRAPARGRSR
jgi:putative hydrolase